MDRPWSDAAAAAAPAPSSWTATGAAAGNSRSRDSWGAPSTSTPQPPQATEDSTSSFRSSSHGLQGYQLQQSPHSSGSGTAKHQQQSAAATSNFNSLEGRGRRSPPPPLNHAQSYSAVQYGSMTQQQHRPSLSYTSYNSWSGGAGPVSSTTPTLEGPATSSAPAYANHAAYATAQDGAHPMWQAVRSYDGPSSAGTERSSSFASTSSNFVSTPATTVDGSSIRSAGPYSGHGRTSLPHYASWPPPNQHVHHPSFHHQHSHPHYPPHPLTAAPHGSDVHHHHQQHYYSNPPDTTPTEAPSSATSLTFPPSSSNSLGGAVYSNWPHPPPLPPRSRSWDDRVQRRDSSFAADVQQQHGSSSEWRGREDGQGDYFGKPEGRYMHPTAPRQYSPNRQSVVSDSHGAQDEQDDIEEHGDTSRGDDDESDPQYEADSAKTLTTTTARKPAAAKRRDSSKSSAAVATGGKDVHKRRYTCHECASEGKESSFTRPSALKTHSYVHSKIKEHTCDVCLRAFSILSNLTRHKNLFTAKAERARKVEGEAGARIVEEQHWQMRFEPHREGKGRRRTKGLNSSSASLTEAIVRRDERVKKTIHETDNYKFHHLLDTTMVEAARDTIAQPA
ncbi:hypothetical protein ACM66B_003904 [Microbotryomycetes sp. NB124-2]